MILYNTMNKSIEYHNGLRVLQSRNTMIVDKLFYFQNAVCSKYRRRRRFIQISNIL